MIYLDNNATTSMDPRVYEVMCPLFFHPYNPSSTHSYGQQARGFLENALKISAENLGVSPKEIVFTSGATEALNMAIHGVLSEKTKGHVITSSLEHSAVLQPLKLHESRGIEVSYVDPKPGNGALTLDQIEEHLKDQTCLIVLIGVNNETGVESPIEQIALLAKSREVPLIVDGVAWMGKKALTIPDGVSAFCISSHKFHGPQGAGIAVLRKGRRWPALIQGGKQQRGLRGGTESLASIVGCAKALYFTKMELEHSIFRMERLRNQFEKGLLESISDIVIHGSDQKRVCNTSNIGFLGVEGETLLMRLDLAGLAASHGSACSSGALEPSRILLNMGVSLEVARSSLRFSLSKFSTEKEIECAIEMIQVEVKHLRKFSSPAISPK